MTRPSVILVGPLPPPVHGVTISTRRLLNSSLGDRFDLRHLDTSDHRSMASVGMLDFRNVALGLLSYWHLLVLCLQRRPDAVYVPISQTALGFLRDSVYLMLPRLIFGATVIIHLRGGHFGTFYENTNIVMRRLVDMAMRRVDRVIVLGDVFRPIFSRWFDPGHIDVVPNGTDLRINGVPDKLRKPNEGPLTVTYMSTLLPEKGIGEFFEAATRVAASHPDITFNFAGGWRAPDTEEERELLGTCKRKGLTDKIRFLGELHGEKKAALLARTDIYVLPTYYPFEGQPNAIIEAMAAGCAVVSTDHAAIPETVLDGETGIIIPTKDTDALETALCRLYKDRSQLWSMAKASYARFLNGYTGDVSSARVGESIARSIADADAY